MNNMICIAGKNNIAVEITQYLQTLGYMNICVVPNSTDDGTGGFQRSFKKYALQKNIPIKTLEEVYKIKNLIFLSLEFNKIVDPEKFLTKQIYNIHFSLLPKYKGMYTSYWPIRNGEKTTGVTLHRIAKGIDTGDIIAQEEFEIKPFDTCKDVYLNYIKHGTVLVKRYLPKILQNKIICKPQKSNESTYYGRNSVNYENISIDLVDTANGIKNQIRALVFREFQLPKINGKEVTHCLITSEVSREKPGTILQEDHWFYKIATIDYNLYVYKDAIEHILSLCQKENCKELQWFIDRSYDINDQNSKGWTPLIVASYHGQYEVVKRLIEHGACISKTNYKGTTPLMYAKDYAFSTNDFKTAQLLFKCGASISQKDYNDKSLKDYISEQYNNDKYNYFLEKLN